MIKNIISLALLIISVSLSFKHGWDTFNYRNNPESVKIMNELGINESFIPFFGVLAVAIGILLLIPRTFFLGNMLNAISILLIMALALRSGNYKMALIEIPFLVMPLLMIWLKYPFKN
ncbi:hypothetical protein SAMN05421841_1957 [Chryseobacterium wanjuense]|uniref:DoxX-like family protein n=2 Tax=Chryseobacterium wanjuense TaxID=356305 RepID=A0A1I0QJZ4_9FLAO|nr:hypothetical protein SAMN05421841_1957 [Chryseobacterium wanjuense]